MHATIPPMKNKRGTTTTINTNSVDIVCVESSGPSSITLLSSLSLILAVSEALGVEDLSSLLLPMPSLSLVFCPPGAVVVVLVALLAVPFPFLALPRSQPIATRSPHAIAPV